MTDKPDDGGFAFPNLVRETLHSPGITAVEVLATGGMKLREWYAGLAMQGLLAGNNSLLSYVSEDAAKLSCKYADALIAELKK